MRIKTTTRQLVVRAALVVAVAATTAASSSPSAAARGVERDFALLDSAGSYWDMFNFTAITPQSAYTEDGRYLKQLPKNYCATKTYTDRLIGYLAANRGDGKPFFAYIAHQAAHDPYHLTRDCTEHFGGSLDATSMTGGESSVNGASGDSLNNPGVGFTLGYQINDNLSLTAGYMATVNDNDSDDLRLDGLRASLTYGGARSWKGRNASRAV